MRFAQCLCPHFCTSPPHLHLHLPSQARLPVTPSHPFPSWSSPLLSPDLVDRLELSSPVARSDRRPEALLCRRPIWSSAQSSAPFFDIRPAASPPTLIQMPTTSATRTMSERPVHGSASSPTTTTTGCRPAASPRFPLNLELPCVSLHFFLNLELPCASLLFWLLMPPWPCLASSFVAHRSPMAPLPLLCC